MLACEGNHEECVETLLSVPELNVNAGYYVSFIDYGRNLQKSNPTIKNCAGFALCADARRGKRIYRHSQEIACDGEGGCKCNLPGKFCAAFRG